MWLLIFFLDTFGLGISTPVDVGQLQAAAVGCPDAAFLVEGFRNGFALGVKEDYCIDPSKVRARPARPLLREKLNSEVSLGRIVGPFKDKPIPDMFISPLSTIPKPGSTKHRLIFNLSYPPGASVNDNILEGMKTVQYCSVHEVGQRLVWKYGSSAWMAKVDLADAYRIVPIRCEDWKFLGMLIDGLYYFDRMLPMGAASSCQLFQRISDGLKAMVLKTQPPDVDIFNYLDDFLFVAGARHACDQAVSEFESMCARIGVPIATHKTVRACKTITFLGLGIDASRLALFIPESKRVQGQLKLEQFLSKDVRRVKCWQSMAGSLNHLAQVATAGRIFLSSTYGGISNILSQRKYLKRRISREVREDLQVWFALLNNPPERPFRVLYSDPACPPLHTDASASVGFGAVWGSQWFFGTWPEGKTCNIAVLELFPIVLAMHMMDSRVSDMTIKVYTDNIALVSVINRLYSRDSLLRRLVRPLVRICLASNINITAAHIPGKDNVGPDMLSRGMINNFRRTFPQMNAAPVQIPLQLLGWLLDMVEWLQ